jgi:prepilin-type N-terminal cleavage/methylation domain-containing protein
MKKNAGFSLVELIVVIAIMAVLVGVLAPAYLKYVEKSRKSTDIDAVAEMMDAAVKVGAEDETAVAGTVFKLKVDSGKVEATVGTSAASYDVNHVQSSWYELIDKEYTLKSKEFRAIDNKTINGTVQKSGAVVWTSCPSEFSEYSTSFAAKFSA